MFSMIKDFYLTLKNYLAFTSIPFKKDRLIVYSEGGHDWPHLGSMLKKFLELSTNEDIIYLSSAINDPGLEFKHKDYKSFYIGSGSIRTILFQNIKATIVLMTLPDLEVFFLKKSLVYPVHYVYCFHSINSAHAVYRDRAFEFYDTIFCVGNHHKIELQREEELKKIKQRNLIEHGSVKLDDLMVSYAPFKGKPNNPVPIVLFAPSWGRGSLLENEDLILKLIRDTLSRGWIPILRLHPMTVRHNPGLIDKLNSTLKPESNSKNFRIETNLNDNTSLKIANIMVSDWSGAATEFAFSLERPVLYIDTEQKINNPDWKSYGIPCLEDFIRNEIGRVLSLENLSQFPNLAEELITQGEAYREKIALAREKFIYNPGRSSEIGAKKLIQLLNE